MFNEWLPIPMLAIAVIVLAAFSGVYVLAETNQETIPFASLILLEEGEAPPEAPPEPPPEAPPAEPPPVETPPEPLPEAPPQEGMPPEGEYIPPQDEYPHEEPSPMSPEEIYEQLPEEVKEYVSEEDIEAMNNMGIEGEAEIAGYVGDMIAEEMGGGQPMEGPSQGEYGPPPEGYPSEGEYPYEGPQEGYPPEEGMPYGPEEGMPPMQPYDEGFPREEEHREGPCGCTTIRCSVECCREPANFEECGRTGPPEKERRGPPEGVENPNKIPEPIKEAGMEQEFIGLICCEMKANMLVEFGAVIDVTVEHFTWASGQVEFLGSLDVSPLTALKALLKQRIEAVCNSTPENFESNMNALMALVEGEGGGGGPMEEAMNGIQFQIEEKMINAMEPYEEKMRRMQEIGDQMRAIGEQMRNTQDQAQQEALMNQMQQLEQEMRELESVGEEMQRMGDSMEQVFGGMESKMESAMNESRNSAEAISWRECAAQKNLELFDKMIDYVLNEISRQRTELEAQGIDASVFDEIEAWLREMREEAKSVFTVNSSEQEKFNFILKMENGMKDIEKKILAQIKGQLFEKFIAQAEENLWNIKSAIKLANEKGVGVSKIESLAGEMEELLEEAKEKMSEAETKEDFEEVKMLLEEFREKGEYAKELYDTIRMKVV